MPIAPSSTSASRPPPEIPAADLLRVVYKELRKLAERKLAHERADHTLQATALVHEVYLRLFERLDRQWVSKSHFLAAAAEAMRRILVDSARAKGTLKRRGKRKVMSLEEVTDDKYLTPERVVEIDDLLAQLAEVDPEAASLMQLRIFAGLSVSEAGGVLNLPRSTAYEVWAFARAWFGTHFESGS